MTEEDRELLELAAKAYFGEEIGDVEFVRWIDEHQVIGRKTDDYGNVFGFFWEPLTDDGDALRLAVALNIQHFEGKNGRIYAKCESPFIRHVVETIPEKLAATRRAIVRIAAEIGKTMP